MVSVLTVSFMIDGYEKLHLSSLKQGLRTKRINWELFGSQVMKIQMGKKKFPN